MNPPRIERIERIELPWKWNLSIFNPYQLIITLFLFKQVLDISLQHNPGFYTFYAWWAYFPQLGALAEGSDHAVQSRHVSDYRAGHSFQQFCTNIFQFQLTCFPFQVF
jgi:hypothetical protein